MTVVDTIRSRARAGDVSLTWYADRRLVARRVGLADVLHALAQAERCTPEPTGDAWRVVGPSLEGAEQTCIVLVEDGLVVLTVY